MIYFSHMEMNQQQAPVVVKGRSNGLWIGTSIFALLACAGMAGVLAYVLLQEEVATVTDVNTEVVQDMGENAVDGATDDMEEEEMQWATYNERGISFEYPEGWHVSASFNYDLVDSMGYVPISVRIGSEPLFLLSPSGGYSGNEEVKIASYKPLTADKDQYEIFDGVEDTLTIGGVSVERLRLRATEEQVYEPAYQEVLFFENEDLSFRVTSVMQANDAVWLRIMNSLRLTDANI